MKIYWTPKHIPELRDLSKAQRKRVCQACYSSDYKFRVIDLLVLRAVAVPGLWLFSKAPTRNVAALVVLGLWIALFIVSQVQIALLRPSIREYLKEHELI